MSVGAALRIKLMQCRIKSAPDKFVVETLRLPPEFSTFAFPHEKQRRTSDSLVVDNLCLFENFIQCYELAQQIDEESAIVQGLEKKL
ncbi:MAG: hypothetical protein ACFNS6_00005, partial [Candidatus Saccharimonas sp.]